MKTFIGLLLVGLFVFGTMSTVAFAACSADHCKAGDTECEKKKKAKTVGA